MLWACAAAAAAGLGRNVTVYHGENNIAGEVPDPGASSGTVLYLGGFDSTAGCEAACVARADCHSFTYHTPAFGAPWAKGCYGRTDWDWHPVKQRDIDSGRVGTPPTPGSCDDDYECSLNGVCSEGRCRCDPAWKGGNCGVLNVVPGEKGAGYWGELTSWGGTALRADDGTYHMWAAEIASSCGMGAWLCNSQVTHLVAKDGPLGAYERREVVWPVFAHEPRTVRAPTGEFVMYWTGGGDGGKPYNAISCTNGPHKQCDCSRGGKCDGGRDWAVALPTLMSWTRDPSGNWSEPVAIPQLSPTIDSNLSPVILPDGSVVGIFRNDAQAPYTASNLHVVTASDWRDASTYKEHSEAPGHDGPEDPFVWRDRLGNFHSINHNYPHPNGVHLFSKTGKGDWRVAPGDEGNGRAYGPEIEWTDGTKATLGSCERPALVMAADGVTPIALTNGCGLPGQPAHTCLRPLNTK